MIFRIFILLIAHLEERYICIYSFLPDRLCRISILCPWRTRHRLHVAWAIVSGMHHHIHHNFQSSVPIALCICIGARNNQSPSPPIKTRTQKSKTQIVVNVVNDALTGIATAKQLVVVVIDWIGEAKAPHCIACRRIHQSTVAIYQWDCEQNL